MNDYQTFVFDIYDSWQAGLGILRLKIVDLSLNTSSKKRKTSCPSIYMFEESKTEEKVGAKDFKKNSIRTSAASDKDSCFEQGNVLALDEQGVTCVHIFQTLLRWRFRRSKR